VPQNLRVRVLEDPNLAQPKLAAATPRRPCKAKRERLRRWVERAKKDIEADPSSFNAERLLSSLGDRQGKHDFSVRLVLAHYEEVLNKGMCIGTSSTYVVPNPSHTQKLSF
jgi:hypothetical protein